MTPVDRSRPPAPSAIRPFDFPEVEHRELGGGLDLRVARAGGFPVVSANLFMRAGESSLDEARAGLAVVAGDALEGGTRRWSGAELAESLERLGARLGVSTGWEGTTVSLSCLAERLDEALGILAETVLEPAFPDDEVTRTRDQQLAQIRQREMDPSSLAADRAARHIFAPGVPYARPLGGSVESVARLGRQDLVEYAAAWYRPATGGLVVVGDVDVAEVEALARGRLGGWSGRPPAGEDFAVEPATRERRVWVVDRPGSVQSEIRVGHLGVERSNPDVYALSVLNTLLGGAFTSRLNLNLRERNGFTYGVRSRFSLRSRPGSFQVSTAVASDVTAPAVREILGELERLVDEGPIDDEVVAARDYIAGVFPLRLESTGQVASRIVEQVVFRLPEDYHRTYRDRIRSVTTDEARDVARRHVRPGEAQIVVVGDAEAVAPALEQLALGPVEVLSVQ
jgi:zinc protease